MLEGRQRRANRAVRPSARRLRHRRRRGGRQLRRAEERPFRRRAASSITSATWATPRSASDVNIGAGTITANYDGRRKHRPSSATARSSAATRPCARRSRSGEGAYTGAGSRRDQGRAARQARRGPARAHSRASAARGGQRLAELSRGNPDHRDPHPAQRPLRGRRVLACARPSHAPRAARRRGQPRRAARPAARVAARRVSWPRSSSGSRSSASWPRPSPAPASSAA